VEVHLQVIKLRGEAVGSKVGGIVKSNPIGLNALIFTRAGIKKLYTFGIVFYGKA
jgi:hypothetical protein